MPAHTQQLLSRRYRLIEKLGEGGMGVVYLAHDRLSGQHVALKLVTSAAFSDENTQALDFRLTLANEFKTLATLRHPNIINVVDYGFDEDQQPYFTMELMQNAHTLIEATRTESEAVKTRRLVELLQAMAYLHRRGILHRDLKPGNVLISNDGILKVLDFGLATDSDQTTELAGTLAYLAPELLQGIGVSTASDLYAIGVMAFELFAGRHPFQDALTAGAGALINSLLMKEPDLSLLAEEKRQTLTLEDTQRKPSTDLPGGDLELDAPTFVYGQSNDDAVVDSIYEQHTIKIDPETVEDASRFVTQPFDNSQTDRTESLDDVLDITEQFTAMSEGSWQEIDSELPAEISTLLDVIGKLLIKIPDLRYSDAYVVIEDLCRVLGQDVPVESAAIRESFLQSATFVERTDEIELLETALENATNKNGSAWLIGGESGVGKSRLLDEMRIRALVHGVTVLRGRAVPDADGARSYQLWHEPLRRVVLTSELDDLDASILKDIVPDIAQLLEYPVDDAPKLEGKEYTQRLHGVIASLFQRQTSPIVLLLEDLQWADESLEVLKLINNMVADLPILIIGSFRIEEKPELPSELPNMQSISLDRLTVTGIRQMSTSIFGKSGQDPQLLEIIYQETGGNAYFIVELLRQLGEQVGRLDQVAPESFQQFIGGGGIQSVLSNRLEKISGLDREMLNLAAIVGREIDLKLMSHIKPQANIDDWLITLSNYAILEIVDEQWQFANGKLRESLIESLNKTQLVNLHGEAAEGLSELYGDDDGKAAQIAQHWQQAGNLGQECAFSYRAGLHALKLGVFPDARQLLERTLKIVESDETADVDIELNALLSSLAEVLFYLAEYGMAQSRAETALAIYEANNDARGTAYAHRLLADIAWQQNNFEVGLEHCDISLQISKTLGDDLGVARALNRAGMIYMNQSEYDTAAEYLTNSLDVIRDLDSQGDLAAALNNIGLVHYYRTNYDKAAEYWEESISISRNVGERHRVAITLINLGAIATINENYEVAETYFLEALSSSQEIGNRNLSAGCLNNLGNLADARGEYDRAEEYYQASWPISESIGMRSHAALTLSNIGDVKLHRGDEDLALHYYQEALAIAHEADGTAFLMEILLKIARITEDPIGKLIICKALVGQQAIPEDVRQSAEELYNATLKAVEVSASQIPLVEIQEIIASLIEEDDEATNDRLPE